MAKLVIGGGKTGNSIARYLDIKGEDFYWLDTRENYAEFESFSSCLGTLNVDVPIELWPEIELLIISPGVSLQQGFIDSAKAKNIEIIGDIELFCREARAPIVGITGSNGKSTVTSLAAHMLAQAGHRVAVGGNLGTPALDLLNDDVDIYVIEISSFQLESCWNPNLFVAVMLNVSPDHLDRHGDIANYAQIKRKIYVGAQCSIENYEDCLCDSSGQAKFKSGFGLQPSEIFDGNQYYISEDGQQLLENGDILLNRSDVPLAGSHNVLNALAAIAICRFFDLSEQALVQAMSGFVGLEHRCENLGKISQHYFINDSKATNEGATIAALSGLRAEYDQIAVLVGGDGKGASFEELAKKISELGIIPVAYGAAKPQLLAAFEREKIQAYQAEGLQESIRVAMQAVNAGALILLSPACASFDEFRNYEERGRAFKQWVQAA